MSINNPILYREVMLAIETLPAYSEEAEDIDDLRCDIEFVRNRLLDAMKHNFSGSGTETCTICFENIRHPVHNRATI